MSQTEFFRKMASSEGDINRKSLHSPEGQRPSLLKDVFEHMTTVTHVLMICLTIYVIYLYGSTDTSNTSHHALFYMIGWYFLINESILSVTDENILSKRISSRLRKHFHWFIAVAGTGLTIAGFVILYVNRTNHFISNHSKLGLASGAIAIAAFITGCPTLFAGTLRNKIPPNWNKLCHGFLSFTAVIVGAASLIEGYYVMWFTMRTTEAERTACFVITVITTTWVLLKPLINMFSRTKRIFS